MHDCDGESNGPRAYFPIQGVSVTAAASSRKIVRVSMNLMLLSLFSRSAFRKFSSCGYVTLFIAPVPFSDRTRLPGTKVQSYSMIASTSSGPLASIPQRSDGVRTTGRF